MDREIKSTSKLYNYNFPSASQFRENLLKANLTLSRINAFYYYNNPPQTLAATPEKIRKSITAPHSSLHPKSIIAATFQAITSDFGVDRIYILKVIKSRKCLRVIEFLDSTKTACNLAGIGFPIGNRNSGFIRCMRRQEPVKITGETPEEKQALKSIQAAQMVIVPFCSQSKVIGILGMDNYQSGKVLPDNILALIAIVASELGMALEHAAAFKEARAVSRQDPLTGLLNRLAIDEVLAKSFRQAVDSKISLSLVMIDVDFFKKFNDQFGHQAGDNILVLIAGTLKKLTRPFDHVGRYGGEEFIAILVDTNIDNALIYAERIRREIERLGRLLSDRFPGLCLTVSAGVSQYEKGIKDRDQLISQADKALYRAKEEGRNCVRAAST